MSRTILKKGITDSMFNSSRKRVLDRSTHAVSLFLTDYPIQSTVAVMHSGTTDYLYFTVNDSVAANHYGGGYCYKYDGINMTQQWKASCAYALNGMAIDNGIATFGNDGNAFFIVQ